MSKKKSKGRSAATELTPKHWVFIETYLKTGRIESSAVAAGFGEKHGNYLMKLPLVRLELDRARAEFRAKSQFNMEQAMEEAEIAVQYAKDHDSPMALVNATKHKADLAGFLVQKVASVEIDIRRVIEDSRAMNPQLNDALMGFLSGWKKQPAQAITVEVFPDDPFDC